MTVRAGERHWLQTSASGVREFMKIFQKNKSDIFNSMNSDLREDILGFGNENRFDIFENMVDDPSSKLYDFIILG